MAEAATQALKRYLVMSKAFVEVIKLVSVGVVKEILFDCATCLDLCQHSSIDSVKDPRHPNEQGRAHLACTDRQLAELSPYTLQ